MNVLKNKTPKKDLALKISAPSFHAIKFAISVETPKERNYFLSKLSRRIDVLRFKEGDNYKQTTLIVFVVFPSSSPPPPFLIVLFA